VKGLSGCVVRQNSKSDLVQGPVVLELEKRLITSLTLGLLYRRVELSSSDNNDDVSDSDLESSSSDNRDSSEAE
jgi:hypothetical protein